MLGADDLVEYAGQLVEARVSNPALLVERAGWNETVIRQAIDLNISALFFAEDSGGASGRAQAIAAALDAALSIVRDSPDAAKSSKSS